MAPQLWDGKLLLADGAGRPKPLADHKRCCCPEPTECPYCTFEAGIPNTWKADLGVGGWIDTVVCEYCDQVAGEYTLPDYSTPNARCRWRYAAGREAGVCGPGAWSDFQIWLLTRWVAAGQWKWHLRAVMHRWSDTFTSCFHQCWESEDSVFSETPDCYDLGGEGPGDKIEMHGVSCPFDLWGSCTDEICTGDLPDPVHIWVPA